MSTLTVEVRATGRRGGLVPQFAVPVPPSVGTGDALTLRELIALAVREELAAASERRNERSLTRVLTERRLEDGAATGAYRSEARHSAPLPPSDVAVARAIEAFGDGLFLVLVDGRQEEDLDAQVTLGPESTMTFVRLVALAGG